MEAQDYYNKNKDKAAELIEQYTSTSVVIMREALKRGHWDYAGRCLGSGQPRKAWTCFWLYQR